MMPTNSSKLQHLIDHIWKDSGLYLILCGSSMSFVENQVLGYQSPLYGRRTGQFKIEPLTYKETALFYSESDNGGEQIHWKRSRFRNEAIGVDELELLKKYASVFGKGKVYHYYIFSKGGFTEGLKALGDKGEVKLITLEDMY